jgi:hypothetical protein
MKDSSFWVAPEKEDRWAHSYRWNAQASRLKETPIPYLYRTQVIEHRWLTAGVLPWAARDSSQPQKTSPGSIR